MSGKPKGDVALTNRERNRAYRVRKQRADLERNRRLAEFEAALHKIAFETETGIDARIIALGVLPNAR
jgi:hypothetical protein